MITAVVLAAGLSRRMGRPKLLLELDGVPVVRLTVERVRAAGLDEIIVVVPPSGSETATALAKALQGLPVRLAVNADPAAGQASSIVAGIGAIGPDTDAALVALGDQPTVPPEVIPALVQALSETRRPIAAPSYRGERGNPVLFAASVFGELRVLSGDRGARAVLEADPARVALVSFPFAMPPDLDTPEDYDRLRSPHNQV